MSSSSWTCRFGIAALAALAAVMGGTFYYWSSRPPFPAYGYAFEAALAIALLIGAVAVRRVRKAACDEFAQTRMRLATQIGFQTGFALYAVVNLAPMLAPQAFRDLFASLDGAREGFILGQVAGMAPFVVGLLIGQAAVLWKYR